MRITFLTWRDTGHPDGGGSEVYVEQIARRLAAHGHQVTIRCARYSGSPAEEYVDGVRLVRRGRRLTVYPWGMLHLLSRSGRAQDVIVDVINGIPFGSPLVRRTDVVALVHHVHQRQWEIIYPGLLGRLGWLLESRLTPWLYRRVPHVTVSEASRRDLEGLGIPRGAIAVVRNGLSPTARQPAAPKSATARLVVLSRLVPHKQIEHALAAVAVLAADFPELHLDVLGSGWWHDELVEAGRREAVQDRVTFHGRVDDTERDRILARAWLALLPSAKEGWGLAVLEAAAQGTPTVGYRGAGGLDESIHDGQTGLLVDGPGQLSEATASLLRDRPRRERMARAAREYAEEFDWETTATAFAETVQQLRSARAVDQDGLVRRVRRRR
ncbi:MAG: glycosyltransferase family 4 protein [Actinomycetota bacterium]|nr:glycosyltransferase family 4 protein [Actinomycetota bacterium]